MYQEALTGVVTEINEKVRWIEEEVLSDQAYFYSAEDTICAADDG